MVQPQEPSHDGAPVKEWRKEQTTRSLVKSQRMKMTLMELAQEPDAETEPGAPRMDAFPSENIGAAGPVSGTMMNERTAPPHRDPPLTEEEPTVESGAVQNSYPPEYDPFGGCSIGNPTFWHIEAFRKCLQFASRALLTWCRFLLCTHTTLECSAKHSYFDWALISDYSAKLHRGAAMPSSSTRIPDWSHVLGGDSQQPGLSLNAEPTCGTWWRSL